MAEVRMHAPEQFIVEELDGGYLVEFERRGHMGARYKVKKLCPHSTAVLEQLAEQLGGKTIAGLQCLIGDLQVRLDQLTDEVDERRRQSAVNDRELRETMHDRLNDLIKLVPPKKREEWLKANKMRRNISGQVVDE